MWRWDYAVGWKERGEELGIEGWMGTGDGDGDGEKEVEMEIEI